MSLKLPLAVDLDGTLTTTDTLLELTLTLIKEHPWQALLLPWWASKGKAYLKAHITSRASIKAELLPYNQELVRYLKDEKAQGRKLILVTASNQSIASQVADFLGIFEAAYGSNDHTNYSGTRKAELLVKLFGHKKFIYAGNSVKDIPVWSEAAQAIVVNAPGHIERAARNLTSVTKVIPPVSFSLKTLWHALRVHQWLKNLLIFIPIITAHQIANAEALQSALLAFCAFSLIASAIYLMNDLLDLEADRLHPIKKHRPFAAGVLHPLVGIIGIPFLIAGSGVLSSYLPGKFLLILGAYATTNIAYSLRLKQVALLDVVILACLYTLRILAGSASTGIVTSSWLFVFAMFMFLSLALVKRVTELINLQQQKKDKAQGRGYTSKDIEPLTMLGISSGFLSLLVLALYISSDTVRLLYSYPQWLWLLIPLLMLWISRVWLLTHRGTMNEDPILFAAKDSLSHTIALAALLTLIIAT